jgi:hypothetical protein
VRWASTAQTEASSALAALRESKSETAEILAVINHRVRTASHANAGYARYYYGDGD